MAVTYERTTGETTRSGDDVDTGVPERPAHYEDFDEAGPEAQPTYADLEHARSARARRRRADTLALIAAGVEDGRYSLMGREVL